MSSLGAGDSIVSFSSKSSHFLKHLVDPGPNMVYTAKFGGLKT
jgi:hypothetical protein